MADINIQELYKGQLDWHEPINENFSNIKEVLEDVVEEASGGGAAMSNISDEFSEVKSYAAGDYCIYLNRLFKFTQAKSAGVWDGTVVIPTIISEELKTQRGDITQNATDIATINGNSVAIREYMEDGANLNDYNTNSKSGYWAISYNASQTIQNLAVNTTSILLVVRSGMYCTQVQYTQAKEQYFRTMNSNGNWSEWTKIATNSDLGYSSSIKWEYSELQNNVTKNFAFNNFYYLILATGVYDNISETLIVPTSYFNFSDAGTRPILLNGNSSISVYKASENSISIDTNNLINHQKFQIFGILRKQ